MRVRNITYNILCAGMTGLMAGLVLALISFFVSCKPTESGYKAAYDAARVKQENRFADIPVPTDIQMDESLRTQVVGGDTIIVSTDILKAVPIEGSSLSTADLANKYGVAVARYRMKTNAMAHAERLQRGGCNPLVATNGADRWYVVEAVYGNIEDACIGLKQLRDKSPRLMTPDLPSLIVIRIRK